MPTAERVHLPTLFEQDETAWLDHMAELAAAGRYAELDYRNLSGYLADMAKRDRRDVFSRFVVLLTHLLKCEYQPDRAGGSWRGTVREQRRELRLLCESGTLRAHALAVLADAYAEARLQAADETELAADHFPPDNPWDFDAALGDAG